MIVTAVHVYVKEKHIQEFIQATSENHRSSFQEPGNLRFDVLQSRDEPGKFLIYEAYESQEAANEHKKTKHYLKWREEVADFMEKPRLGVAYDVICPEDREAW